MSEFRGRDHGLDIRNPEVKDARLAWEPRLNKPVYPKIGTLTKALT